MIRLTGKKPATGFHIQLKNKWTVSVQMGPGTYSDNHDAIDLLCNNDVERTAELMARPCYTVEIAAWAEGDVLFPMRDAGDTVSGYVKATEIPAILQRVEDFPARLDLNDTSFIANAQCEDISRQRIYALNRVFEYEDVRKQTPSYELTRLSERAAEAIEACKARGIELSVPESVANHLATPITKGY